MAHRPDILLLEGSEETVALGTRSALNALVIPYQAARVEYSPQLRAGEDTAGVYLHMPVLRMPGVRLVDLASVHRTIDGVTATLSSWRYAEITDPEDPGYGWGWHRYGMDAAAGRAPLYSVNHGDGVGWLLGSHQQLVRACYLNSEAGRRVQQRVVSSAGRVSSLALTEEDLSSLEQDLTRDGEQVTSWVWHPDEQDSEEFRAF